MSGFVIADSSAWIEFLRSTGSDVDMRLDVALREGRLLVAEPVLMELLYGARSRDEWLDIQRLTYACDLARAHGPTDWIEAAALRRRMQRAGRTIASALDCLIAVVAMRIDAAVLHKDADFDAIAEVAPLKLA